MSAYLIVRADVADEDHDAFDRWYETEHLPDAHAVFGSLSARRGWSDLSPNVHFAIYEFATIEAARAAVASEGMKTMIAEFDRVWEDRVTRTREIVGVKLTL